MRRQYFVHYYKDFGNTYNLLYADTEEALKAVPEEAERITRKKAESLVADENRRRKADGSFSGYADNAIWPADATDYELMNLNGKYLEKVGCIMERRTK